MDIEIPMTTKERADRVDVIKDFFKKTFAKHEPKFHYSQEWGGFVTVSLFQIDGLHGLSKIEKDIEHKLQTTFHRLALLDIKIITSSFDARDSLNDKSNGSATMICQLGKKEITV